MRLAVVVALAGCGRIGFDPFGPPSPPGDGRPAGDASTVDAIDGPPPDGFACAIPSGWSTPVELTTLSSSFDDWSPTMSGDQLRIIFQSNRVANDSDLYEATRSSTAATFGNVTVLTALNSTSSEDAPTLSFDGLDVYYTSDRGGAKHLYHAHRPSVNAAFGAPAVVAIAGATMILGPSLSHTGRELFFNDANETQVSRAVYDGMQFVLDGPVTELGSAGYAALTPDELTIYFDRIGPPSQIYSATRPAFGAPFGTPVLVPNLPMGNFAEEDADLGADGQTLVFAISPTAGNANIYQSTRTCQ